MFNSTMMDQDKIHLLTEAIYKNIIDSFNPGCKQLMTTGRAYQKALHNVAAASKAFTDCVYNLAESAQVCKGATSQIGAALVQIAEVQKEINTQAIENVKSFHAEVLIPMESAQDNETKQVQMLHKKYVAGHKYHVGTVDKANSGLKKHQKKTKAKYGFDQKEMQCAREVKESRLKLEEYHSHNLRLALMEERKRYCFLLERLCSIVRVYASHHSKAHEFLTHRLPEWTSLYKNPHILPEASEQVLQAFKPQEDVYNNPDEGNDANGDSSSNGVDSRHSSSNPDSASQTGPITQRGDSHKTKGDNLSMTYGVVMGNMANMSNGIYGNRNEGVVGPPQGILIRPKVRAVYDHVAADDTQMTFNEGDVITLVGEKRDGWHYGENNTTQRAGWFPLSFTEAVHHHTPNIPRSNSFSLSTKKVQSLGNLADTRQQHYHLEPQHPHVNIPSSGHSDPESATVRMREHRTYTMSERPLTMHGPPPTSPAQNVNNTSVHLMPSPYSTNVGSKGDSHISDRQRKHSLPNHDYLPPPPQHEQPLPPAPHQLPPSNTRVNPPPLEHSKSNPALLPRVPMPLPTTPSHGPYDVPPNVDYANHPRASNIYCSSPTPSPGNSSSGYSGSTGNARQQTTSSSQYAVYGSSPGFPPPPPNLAPPPPPTSDYDEDPPTVVYVRANQLNHLTHHHIPTSTSNHK